MCDDARLPTVEPDYRFTLANERTFLAWIRTALALVAGGVAVRQVTVTSEEGRALVVMLAITSLSTALIVTVGSALHWDRSQDAIRLGRPLPATRLVPALAVSLTVLAGIGLVLIAVT